MIKKYKMFDIFIIYYFKFIILNLFIVYLFSLLI